ncbi:Peptide-methionine (S)-S-oxide reductase [Cladochytrium tenue]|nr:Peptide-methionine (S)-S-oxide reductase [Cladochytrium tenue]
MPIAVFAAGCFWGVEKSFRRKYGAAIRDVRVGYVGGQAISPSYEQVCTSKTGHAEAIRLEFDESSLPNGYAGLVDFFLRMHDPTTALRQGGDVGPQYRSAVVVLEGGAEGERQRAVAEAGIARAKAAYEGAKGAKIVTTVEGPGAGWFDAEQYHQEYLEKNPHGYECPTHFERTWERIAQLYGGTVPPPLA